MIKLSELDVSIQETLEQELEDQPKLVQTLKTALLERLQQDFDVVDDTGDDGEDDEEESSED